MSQTVYMWKERPDSSSAAAATLSLWAPPHAFEPQLPFRVFPPTNGYSALISLLMLDILDYHGATCGGQYLLCVFIDVVLLLCIVNICQFNIIK